MNKIFYLSSCDTCKKIMKEINAIKSFELQDIKQKHISASELDELKKKMGGYEILLNKRAQKLRELNIDFSSYKDYDYRSLILKDYTFLKRPVIIIGDRAFAGNSPVLINTVNSLI